MTFGLLLLLSPLLGRGAGRDPDLSTASSWRCGIFIPGEKWKPPRAKFFVLQSIHAATCPAKAGLMWCQYSIHYKFVKLVSGM